MVTEKETTMKKILLSLALVVLLANTSYTAYAGDIRLVRESEAGVGKTLGHYVSLVDCRNAMEVAYLEWSVHDVGMAQQRQKFNPNDSQWTLKHDFPMLRLSQGDQATLIAYSKFSCS